MDEMFRDFSRSGGQRRRDDARPGGDARRGTGSASREPSHANIRDYREERAGSRSASSYSGRSASVSQSGGAYRRSSGYGASSRSASAAARRRRQQQKRQRAILVGFLLLLALLGATVFVVLKSCSPAENAPVTPVPVDPATTQFPEEVYINGALITGMSIDDARALLMPGIEETASRISITLSGEMGGQTFRETISAADMNITCDIEQVMLNALAGGKAKAYNTAFTIDYDALDSRIKEISNALTFGPSDATFSLTVGKDGEPDLKYTDGKPGMGVDIPATEQAVREALERGEYQAVLTPKLTEQQPSITVDDLKKQVTLIGKFTTSYRHKGLSEWTEERKETILNRSFNVEKAAKLINEQVVNPGKTWSYNETVGDRNEENGWKMANAIVGGETYRAEYGGGVCQVSTTLYNALLQANIEIVSRRKHSIPADYVPLGLDATVDTGHIDFKFKNNTKYPLYIFAYTEATSSRKSEITVLLYGQALPEGVTYEARAVQIEETLPDEPIITYDKKMLADAEPIETVAARNGYKVEVYLDKKVNGEVVESKYLYTDEYAAIRQKITMGTLIPVVEAPIIAPDPGVIVNPEDMP